MYGEWTQCGEVAYLCEGPPTSRMSASEWPGSLPAACVSVLMRLPPLFLFQRSDISKARGTERGSR